MSKTTKVGMNVGDMSWNEMYNIVTRQLDKLAMCKRGSIHTDANLMKEKLGKKPEFNKDEREVIRKSLASKVQKCFRPTLKQCEKQSVYEVAQICSDKAAKVVRNCYDHPDVEQWLLDRKKIDKMSEEREATCDGDFQDVKDNFSLKIVPIEDFPKVRNKLEATEW